VIDHLSHWTHLEGNRAEQCVASVNGPRGRLSSDELTRVIVRLSAIGAGGRGAAARKVTSVLLRTCTSARTLEVPELGDGLELAFRDLPTQESFFVSSRIRSSLLASIGLAADALAGVRDEPDGPDAAFEGAAAPVEDIRPGARVVDTAEPRKVYPGRHGLSPRMERDGLPIYLRPQDVPDGWPQAVWRVGEVEGLRWRIRGGERAMLVADAFTILGPITTSQALGVGGASVEHVMAEIGSLSRDQVRGFGWSGARAFDHPVLDRHDPLSASQRRVCWTVVGAIEARAQEVDPDAGGEYYSGCYFVYRLDDARWLAAMNAAVLAVSTAVLSDRLTPEQVDLRTRPWRVLAGDLPADALPAMDDPGLSVSPSEALVKALVPRRERGLAGQLWPRVAFPIRHPIWTVSTIILRADRGLGRRPG
jgi:hypothetical protein